MKWTWNHTIMLLIASILLTIVIYLVFDLFLLILLFIPPIVMLKHLKK